MLSRKGSAMRKSLIVAAISAFVIFAHIPCFAQSNPTQPIELATHENEHSSAQLTLARMGQKIGIAVIFKGTDDLHFYAVKETAGGGYNLTVTPSGQGLIFGEPVFPNWTYFTDSFGNKVEVYAGNFTVFVPIEKYTGTTSKFNVSAKISFLACTSKVCLIPDEKTLNTTINTGQTDSWQKISFEPIDKTRQKAGVPSTSYSWPFAFGLAIIAGLTLNIMPCVWPILPIIVMRLWNQASHSRTRSIAFGLMFSVGILLFFAAIAVANIILHLSYGMVFQWGDHMRNPAFVTSMGLLMVALGLFMFDIFTIGIPSSVTGKAGSGQGWLGAIAMGFLAALLATPCSFAILAAAFAWAQTQNLPIATLAIMLIGVGMALPYMILTTAPGLLNRLPKPGGWMDGVKKIMGFMLFFIAVKLIGALPSERFTNVLYYVVILSFCVWMWGKWVTFSTPKSKKLMVRTAAVLLAVAAAFAMLKAPTKYIDWQDYDPDQISEAVEKNKPVLIKFTAKWCVNCSVVDRLVYKQKDIADLIKQKGILAVIADTTVSDALATIDLVEKYKEPGTLPVTILQFPDIDHQKLRGIFGKDDLKQAIKDLPDIGQ